MQATESTAPSKATKPRRSVRSACPVRVGVSANLAERGGGGINQLPKRKFMNRFPLLSRFERRRNRVNSSGFAHPCYAISECLLCIPKP